MITEYHEIEKNSILDDTYKTRSGEIKKNAWYEKKTKNLKLANSYSRLKEFNKSERVSNCATYLEFKEYIDSGEKKLDKANFCGNRLCPLCSWRRQLKIFSQVSNITDAMQKKEILEKRSGELKINEYYEKLDFIMTNLTIRTCTGDELPEKITLMLKAYMDMIRTQRFKKMIVGSFRALEITFDNQPIITADMYYGNLAKHMYSREDHYQKLGLRIGDPNPNYKMFHPHIHSLWAVDKYYFSHNYMEQRELQELWEKQTAQDKAIAYIKKIKDNDRQEKYNAVCEVAKYTLKDGEFILSNNPDLTDYAVSVFDKSLKDRRLVSFAGLFKDLHKLLNLSDPVEDDLVIISGDEENNKIYKTLKYQWRIGLYNKFNYYQIKEN